MWIFWSAGTGAQRGVALHPWGFQDFDYKRPSAAWSCFEVNSAGSSTRWPTEIPSNLNYSTILRKWGLCFMNRHCMVQQTNTTKEWKVLSLLKIKHFFSLAKIWVEDFLSNTRMYFLAEKGWCKSTVPAECRCLAHQQVRCEKTDLWTLSLAGLSLGKKRKGNHLYLKFCWNRVKQ